MIRKYELALAARLLDMAGEQFGNHGCNDFNLIDELDLHPSQLVELDRKIHEWNGDLEEHDPARAAEGEQADFVLMHYLAERFQKEATGCDIASGLELDVVDQLREGRRRAGERRQRIVELELQLDALCSRLGITRRDAERLAGG